MNTPAIRIQACSHTAAQTHDYLHKSRQRLGLPDEDLWAIDLEAAFPSPTVSEPVPVVRGDIGLVGAGEEFPTLEVSR